MNLITFDELSQATGLSKYKIRYYQHEGFFRAALNFGAPVAAPAQSSYDSRSIKVWREAVEYMKAGLGELEALEQATQDIFGYQAHTPW
jgi:hypothetical protein